MRRGGLGQGRGGGGGGGAGGGGGGGGGGLPGLSSEQREVLLAHYLLAHHGGDPVELLQELDRRQGAARGGGVGGVRAGV